MSTSSSPSWSSSQLLRPGSSEQPRFNQPIVIMLVLNFYYCNCTIFPDSIVQGLAVIKRNFMVKSPFSLLWSYNGVNLFILSHTEITEQRSSKIEKAATCAVSHKPALNSSASAGATTLRSLDDLKKV